VISDSYGRDSTALLIEEPAGLSAAEESALIAAAEWLAHHGGFAVWLAGERLTAVDRLDIVPVALFDRTVDAPPAVTEADWSPPPGAPAVVRLPPPEGQPRMDSIAEKKLEEALEVLHWAVGRLWNRPYQLSPLTRRYLPDLHWPQERVVVEIDGPEHYRAGHKADDDLRDAQFVKAGYAVLRFHNGQVLGDTQAVVARIENLVRDRRREKQESPHAN
jgi:very-short-patch-repair endonuclease